MTSPGIAARLNFCKACRAASGGRMKANTLGLAAALSVVLGFAPAAFAADVAPPYVAPPSWTGIYIGVNGGYGWSNGIVTESPFQSFPGTAVVPADFVGQNVYGALFGVHAGYNWQVAAFVLGVEGDFDAASMANSSQVVLLAVGAKRPTVS
jgi:outer membrane immunogenic protein